MTLLSRTAENLYWLGRHLERIEWSARSVREHTHLLVDLPIHVESDWSALLALSGFEAEPEGSEPGESDVIHTVMASLDNPGSIIRSIAAARENLRVTRSVAPWSAWEALNTLHIAVSSRANACGSRSQRLDLCDAIIEWCQLIAGILVTTMSRDHAFALYDLGRHIERADMAARVLDVRAGSLLIGSGDAEHPADRSPFEDVRWLGVLRTTGGMQMYHRRKSSSVEAETVLDFLLYDVAFPRSIAYCILEMGIALEALPRRADAADACDALARLLAARPATMSSMTLHERVGRIMEGLDRLHDAVATSYFVARTPAAAAV